MNQAGIDLLKEFEGLAPKLPDGRFRAYWDDLGGVWTGPYGFTADVTKDSAWTQEEADARLNREISQYEQSVRRACTMPPNENELAAMTCLAWNIGVSGFKRSTVLRSHNKAEPEAAARAFALWNQAGGKVVRGLTRRRAAEAALYLKPTYGELDMPQRVDPESSLKDSSIVKGSTVTAGAGILATISAGATSVKEFAESFGVADYLPYVLVAVLITGAVYVILQRKKQRDGGWA